MTLNYRFWQNLFVIGFKTVAGAAALMFVTSMLIHVTTSKLEHLREIRTQENANFVTTAAREKQLQCLARNIYHEAGFENFEGKVAVAQVTLNRASSGQFPSDICSVVYQKDVIYSRVICQFSWYCEGPAALKPINPMAFNESMAVAKKVLLEGFKLDGLKEAMYYHNDQVNPRWGLKKIAVIGHHTFYSSHKL
jgi:N-acetylmuramoyl-L-alanine amidase